MQNTSQESRVQVTKFEKTYMAAIEAVVEEILKRLARKGVHRVTRQQALTFSKMDNVIKPSIRAVYDSIGQSLLPGRA